MNVSQEANNHKIEKMEKAVGPHHKDPALGTLGGGELRRLVKLSNKSARPLEMKSWRVHGCGWNSSSYMDEDSKVC